ncbi:MAG: hypothetical protein NTW86_09945 [Candidatus Sumerlaeota bacterium]|nr:hypothetical protein [Candidatus Sumerlaeota bacterium]
MGLMKGQVVEINQRRGMVAVFTEDEEYSIIELLGDELETGDVLQWNGHYPLGSETIRNLTKRAAMTVYFQNHSVPKSQLRQQLLY